MEKGNPRTSKANRRHREGSPQKQNSIRREPVPKGCAGYVSETCNRPHDLRGATGTTRGAAGTSTTPEAKSRGQVKGQSRGIEHLQESQG